MEPNETPVTPESETGSLLPTPIKQLSGSDLDRVQNWASQSKRGLIHICSYSEGGKKCYHPLTIVRDPKTGNQPLVCTDPEGIQVQFGVCSWAGIAHEEQPIYPPKGEEEL